MRDQGKISLTIIIIVLAVVLPMLYLGYFSVKPVPDIRNLPEFDPGKVNEVLIIAPHNDDEVLGPGGMIQKHLRDGANVRVVMMTNGDGQYRGPFATNKKKEIELGYRRQKETLNALANLGLDRKNVIFLGYPDRGLSKLWDDNWTCDSLYVSKRTGENHTEYNDSYNRGAPYCGISVFQDLTKIIGNNTPDLIYLPHPDDLHPDHWATNAFVVYTIEKLKAQNPSNEKLKNIREVTYLVHFWRWPLPRGKKTDAPLAPPKELAQRDTHWVKCDLLPDDVTRKLESILMYKSQMEYMPRYLQSFARRDELFGLLAPLKLNISSSIQNYPSDPSLLSGNESEESSEPAPFLTYFDPIHRNIYRNIRHFNDIRAVNVAGDSDKLKITIDCLRKISTASDLTVHIKPITGSIENSSFRFEYKDGIMLLNNKKFSSDNRISYTINNNSFTIEVPFDYIGNPVKIVLGSELLRKGITFSKSAYRVIDLS